MLSEIETLWALAGFAQAHWQMLRLLRWQQVCQKEGSRKVVGLTCFSVACSVGAPAFLVFSRERATGA